MKLTILAVLCCGASAATAAPAPTVTVEPAGLKELQRTIDAYRALGDFSVASIDVVVQKPPSKFQEFEAGVERVVSKGRFGSDGRRAISVSISEKGRDVPYKFNRIYDGKNIIQSYNGAERRQFSAINPATKANSLDWFFLRSPGMEVIAKVVAAETSQQFINGDAPEIKVRSLGNGASVVELNYKKSDDFSSYTLGKEGFLERFEYRAKGSTFSIASIFSRPLPLTIAKPFDWESFVPSNPQ
ncbi:hypothetical protein EON80_26540 [bacterium]|nr:MAG: hypothetical protein EON80_26540 [bacterium]